MATKGMSKNSRTSRAAKPGGFEPSPSIDRFIATGGGNFAYVLTPDGRTAHGKVGSEKFLAALEILHAFPGMDARVTAEIEALDATFPDAGWAQSWAAVTASEAAA